MNIAIIGSGNIVNGCLDAIGFIKEIHISAICVREASIQKGKELSQKYGIEKIYTDYSKLLEDEAIEFVYLGIVNSEHYNYAKQALLAGKNVICEKPFTSLLTEIQELARIAIENKLYLFEAITLLHFENYKYIKDNIGRIGNIKLIQCNFSQYSSRYAKYMEGEILPVFDPKFSGGALYDLNIYNLHFVLGLFGKYKKAKYYPNLGYNGIDTSGICIFEYDSFIATCIAAKDSSSNNFAIIQGDCGYIKVEGATNTCSKVYLKIGNEEHVNESVHNNHMIEEFTSFEKIYSEKDLQTCYNLLEHSINIMETLESVRKKASIEFGCDR